MNVRLISTYTVNPYHLKSCELDYYPWRGVVNAISFDKVCQYFVTGRLLFPGASSRRKSMVSTNINLRQYIYCILETRSFSFFLVVGVLCCMMVFLLLKTFKLFRLEVFHLWTYPMKIIYIYKNYISTVVF